MAQTACAAAPLDEGFDAFLATLRIAASAAGPAPPNLAELRHSAAAARKAFNRGGPAMQSIEDLMLRRDGWQIPARIYRPTKSAISPALLYLHGGGWTLLGIDTHDRLMREYASASGWTIIGLDYPRAPETTFPATSEACVASFLALIEQADQLGIELGRLAIGGDSSGANLAVATALSLRDAGRPQAAGLLLNYGVYDCDTTRPSYLAYGAEPYLLTRGRMEWFWSCYCPEETLRSSPLASPLRADLSRLPPARLVVAELDILRDENLAFAEALAAAGNPVVVDRYSGAPHAFLEAFAPTSHRAIECAGLWLRSLALAERGK